MRRQGPPSAPRISTKRLRRTSGNTVVRWLSQSFNVGSSPAAGATRRFVYAGQPRSAVPNQVLVAVGGSQAGTALLCCVPLHTRPLHARWRTNTATTQAHHSPEARRPTWQAGQRALHEVSERLPRHVVIRASAVHKVHGHIQHVIHVALKPKPGLKHKRQRATPAGRGPEAAACVGPCGAAGRARCAARTPRSGAWPASRHSMPHHTTGSPAQRNQYAQPTATPCRRCAHRSGSVSVHTWLRQLR